MRKTYQHTFKNGKTVRYVVEFVAGLPIFLTKPEDFLDSAPTEMRGEYRQWLETVVFPDVAEIM